MTAWNKVLAEAEVEEEKRDLISREIGKFREIMKVRQYFFLLWVALGYRVYRSLSNLMSWRHIYLHF